MVAQGFGDEIRRARIARGLTQVELAERLRASVTTISNWEREVTKPALEDIDPLCVALSPHPNRKPR